MPRVCPQAAYERSTFPGLGPPEYFDPAEPRAWRRHRELFYGEGGCRVGCTPPGLCNPEVQLGPRPPLGGAILAGQPVPELATLQLPQIALCDASERR